MKQLTGIWELLQTLVAYPWIIIKLLDDSKLGKRLGLAGQNKYQKNFTLDIIGPQYEKVFGS